MDEQNIWPPCSADVGSFRFLKHCKFLQSKERSFFFFFKGWNIGDVGFSGILYYQNFRCFKLSQRFSISVTEKNCFPVTFVFTMIVSDKPKQDKERCPKTSYTLDNGANQTICCPVSGFPPPFITWKKNGVQLNKESSVLAIYNLRDEDLGNYSCTATDFKTSVGPIDITIKKKGNLR